MEKILDKVKIFSRPSHEPIFAWIKSNTKVLDMGCGDGSLGMTLIQEKKCKVYGIDINKENVRKARKRGVLARVGNLDEKTDFKDNFFDYVILCHVLEHVYKPLKVLKEAKRVSKSKITVASPNLGFLLCRLQLLKGNFPNVVLFGYEWYNTDHIRLFTFSDFVHALKTLNLKIKKIECLAPIAHGVWVKTWEREKLFKKPIAFLMRHFPNLLSLVFIMELEM